MTQTLVPPYNVEKHGDNRYRIIGAAVGLQQSDLDLQVERGVLAVSGGDNVIYLLHGIAQRTFKFLVSYADDIGE